MEVIGAIAAFGVLIGLAFAANHYSGVAMEMMEEAKSASHGIGWSVVWIGLALLCGLLMLLLTTMSHNAARSYQPPPSQFQPR